MTHTSRWNATQREVFSAIIQGKGVIFVSPVERMIQLGMFADDAYAIQKWFLDRNDLEGLERYIENRKNFNPEVSDR